MTRSRSRGHILVVEDEAALRVIAQDVLTGAGYTVSACANGREALAALERDRHDAVLSDVRMPDMDGLGLLRAVRAKDLDLPIVLWTGVPSVESAAQAVEYGALQYLIKPVPSQVLLESVARAVKLGALARLKREALVAAGLDKLVGDRAGLEAAFARALGALWIAYQPIVHAGDGRLYAHEALVRTTEPLFPNPGAFLTAAESLGRFADLGVAIRDSVTATLASGALAGDAFVNIHPRDLLDPAILDSRSPLSRIAPRVVLEITERASLEGIADLKDRIAALRGMGYRIAIDDLGAGYAGLTSFAALGPEIVKLDMGLIRGLDSDAVKRKLVGSIAGLCRDLGALVVAEGVETPAERDATAHAGCDLLQGFLIGRPLPVKP